MDEAESVGPAERAKLKRAKRESRTTIQDSREEGQEKRKVSRKGTSGGGRKKRLIELEASSSLSSLGQKDEGNDSGYHESRTLTIDTEEDEEDLAAPICAARALPPAPNPFAEDWNKIFPSLPRQLERFASPRALLSLLETPYAERSLPAPFKLEMATSSHEAILVKCTTEGCGYAAVAQKDTKWEEGCPWVVEGEWSELRHSHAPPGVMVQDEKMDDVEMKVGVSAMEVEQEEQNAEVGAEPKRSDETPSSPPVAVVQRPPTPTSKRPQLHLITNSRPPPRRRASDDLTLLSSLSFNAQSFTLSSRAQSSPPVFNFSFSPTSRRNTSSISPRSTSLDFCGSDTGTSLGRETTSTPTLTEPEVEEEGKEETGEVGGVEVRSAEPIAILLSALHPSLVVLNPELEKLGVEDGESFVDFVLLEEEGLVRLIKSAREASAREQEWSMLQQELVGLKKDWEMTAE